jgi:putative transposase
LMIHRSRIYYVKACNDDSIIANEIVEVYCEFPIYGYRRIREMLRCKGIVANGKRVLRVMRELGLRAIYPGPKTTLRDTSNAIYPYALRGLTITHPHQVWQVDITYLRTHSGFIYLTALIDRYTRMIVSWGLSNTLDADNCVRVLDSGIHTYGRPKIINSDQGCQFTGDAWIGSLTHHHIHISMSGQGRSNDNAHIERLWRTLKYEYLYLRNPRTVSEYKQLLPQFVQWYNCERPHQALGYLTPYQMLTKTKTTATNDSLSLVS